MHSPIFDSFSLISLDEIFLWIHTDMADSELLVHLTPEDCQTNKYKLVLGRTQFVGSEFGNFGGFEWVRSSILVGEPGFERVRSSD